MHGRRGLLPRTGLQRGLDLGRYGERLVRAGSERGRERRHAHHRRQRDERGGGQLADAQLAVDHALAHLLPALHLSGARASWGSSGGSKRVGQCFWFACWQQLVFYVPYLRLWSPSRNLVELPVETSLYSSSALFCLTAPVAAPAQGRRGS